jgi:mono/diheme cytochrome c family protein
MISRRVSFVFVVVAAGLIVVGGALVAWSGATVVPVEESEGRTVFLDAGCASCHTLRDARARNRVAPDLDVVRPGAGQVESVVRRGAAGMPSFVGVLSDEEIRAVSDYVADVAGR